MALNTCLRQLFIKTKNNLRSFSSESYTHKVSIKIDPAIVEKKNKEYIKKYNWFDNTKVESEKIWNVYKERINDSNISLFRPSYFVERKAIPFKNKKIKSYLKIKNFLVFDSTEKEKEYVKDSFKKLGFVVGEIFYLTNDVGFPSGDLILSIVNKDVTEEDLSLLNNNDLNYFSNSLNDLTTANENIESMVEFDNQQNRTESVVISEDVLFDSSKITILLKSTCLKTTECLEKIHQKLCLDIKQRKTEILEIQNESSNSQISHDVKMIDYAISELHERIVVLQNARSTSLERLSVIEHGRVFINAMLLKLLDPLFEINEQELHFFKTLHNELENENSSGVVYDKVKNFLRCKNGDLALKKLKNMFGVATDESPQEKFTNEFLSDFDEININRYSDNIEEIYNDTESFSSYKENRDVKFFMEKLMEQSVEIDALEKHIRDLESNKEKLIQSFKPLGQKEVEKIKLQNVKNKILRALGDAIKVKNEKNL